MKQEDELKKQAQAPDLTPKLDLGFKEGQTITLNIGVTLFSIKSNVFVDLKAVLTIEPRNIYQYFKKRNHSKRQLRINSSEGLKLLKV